MSVSSAWSPQLKRIPRFSGYIITEFDFLRQTSSSDTSTALHSSFGSVLYGLITSLVLDDAARLSIGVGLYLERLND